MVIEQPTKQMKPNAAPDWYYDPGRTPQELRSAFRREDWTSSTKGMGLGYVPMNLVILPQADAYDFLVFCFRNPKPCPLIEVTEPGDPVPIYCAPDADLRADLPKYCVYEKGRLVEEVLNIMDYWRGDLVCFLIGATAGADRVLMEAGVPVRQLEETHSHVAYMSNIPAQPAGRFHSGHLVVPMRPLTPAQAIRAIQITTRLPALQGAPIHIGDPTAIGIQDLSKPDFGVPVTIKEGETPVFWAGGATAQIVAMESRIDFMITHAPGHMFISNLIPAELTVL
jgi:uncharacterized protein YcsI (UPF0317 family)